MTKPDIISAINLKMKWYLGLAFSIQTSYIEILKQKNWGCIRKLFEPKSSSNEVIFTIGDDMCVELLLAWQPHVGD